MVRRIFLITTYECNLRCKYCYESNKHEGSFNVSKTIEILTTEFEQQQFDEFRISFYGGEPFLEFPKIKEICEWMWDSYPQKNILAQVSTNGTVLTDDIRQWLKVNEKRFEVSISIDGEKGNHNKSRGNSFDLIDIPFFTSLYGIKAKMTVAPDTIGNMIQNYLYLKSLGFKVSPSIAQEIEWKKEQLVVYQQQLALFIYYILENPQEELPPFFRYRLQKLAPIHHGESRWNCGSGYFEVAYDIKGNFYPCHAYAAQFKEYNIEQVAMVMHTLTNSSFDETMLMCKDCFYKHVCSPCHGFNYTNRGDMDKLNPVTCELNKLAIKATIKLYTLAIPKKNDYVWLVNVPENELIDIINGIKCFVEYEL